MRLAYRGDDATPSSRVLLMHRPLLVQGFCASTAVKCHLLRCRDQGFGAFARYLRWCQYDELINGNDLWCKSPAVFVNRCRLLQQCLQVGRMFSTQVVYFLYSE